MPMSNLIEKALEKKGLSMVEALSNCQTQYGRLNREGSAVRMIQAMKDTAVPISKAKKMTPEQLEGKQVIGMLHNIDRPGYLEQYQKIIDMCNPPQKKTDEAEKVEENGKEV